MEIFPHFRIKHSARLQVLFLACWLTHACLLACSLQCPMCGTVLEQQQDIPWVWQETPRCPGDCPVLRVLSYGTGNHHVFGVLLHLPVMTIQQLINPFFPVPLQGFLICSIAGSCQHPKYPPWATPKPSCLGVRAVSARGTGLVAPSTVQPVTASHTGHPGTLSIKTLSFVPNVIKKYSRTTWDNDWQWVL